MQNNQEQKLLANFRLLTESQRNHISAMVAGLADIRRRKCPLRLIFGGKN